MGGGGDTEIKETAAEVAAAEVAKKHWEIYNNDLKQFEETFIQRVDNMNDERKFDKTKQDADIAFNQQYSNARRGATEQMASAGIDPSTAKAKETLSDISTEQAIEQTDTVNRAQTAQQDQYLGGLKNVVAMGAGKAAEATAGMGDIANMSAQKAQFDAQNSFNKRQANQNLVGTVVGAGAAYGLRDAPKAAAQNYTPPPLSTGTHGVTPGGMQVNSNKYDPLGRGW